MKLGAKRLLAFVQILLVTSLIFVFSVNFSSTKVFAQEEGQVCCEKDNLGNYCSYVSASQCTGAGVLKASTSCDQTSFCKPGCCAGVDGFCYNNYPRALCEKRYNGSYNSDSSCGAVSECKLGCCIIGTQAAYVTRSRCVNETSAFPDLEVDFREDVNSEQECLNLARNTEKGCCVTSDRQCKYGAKSECTAETVVNGTGFYKDTFCSSLRNQCDCAPHAQGDPRATLCLPNDDKVYWKDSCGNPEGVVTGIDLTKYGGAKADGNCDYNQGNLCGDSNKDGIHVCESLDCQGGSSKITTNKNLSVNILNYHAAGGDRGTQLTELSQDSILNGESWCEFDSPLQQQIFNPLSTADRQGKDPVGSRYYRSLCINGQELVEPCKDFREEYCYHNTIDVALNSTTGSSSTTRKYTEARCIVNEWQPCVNECNTANPNTMDQRTYQEALKKDQQCCLSPKRDCTWTGNRCVPAVSPGFKFWEGEGADICGRANTQCTATFVCGGFNRIFGCGNNAAAGITGGGIAAVGAGGYTALTLGATAGAALGPVAVAAIGAGLLVGLSSGLHGGWQIVSGGECLSQDYLQAANNLCRSHGDCGADFNYLNSYGGIDNKFTLSYAGFSNTQNISEEISDYAQDHKDDLQKKKSSSDRGDVEFTFTGGVPGNLSEPSWDRGQSFYNFSSQGHGPGGKFARALFTQPELFGQSWLNAPAFGLLTVVGGFTFAGLFSGDVSALAGAGYGLSASPLGFLVSKGIGAISEEAGKQLSLSAARDAAAKEASNGFAGQAGTQGSVQQGVLKESLLDAGVKEDVIKNLNPQQLGEIANGRAASSINENVAKEAANKASAQYGKNQAATSFSGIMTGVSAALWAYTAYQLIDVLFEDVQPVTISTTCQPWQAPVYRVSATEDDPCQKCNPQYKPGENGYVSQTKVPQDVRAFKACSEYRCKSLGPNCELINKGTTEETCVSINKLDTNSPKIEPWPEGFTLNISKNDIVQTGTGFRVTKQVPIYSPFNVGLKTDEPSQCKMSFQHSRRYNDMESNFFGSNTFSYFHVNTMVYPATRNATESTVMLTGGGHYKLYLRCTDAVGNANEADYVIEFDVSNEPDLTAPTIVGSSLSPPVGVGLASQTTLAKEVYLMNSANYTDVTLFVNEPSECGYSYVPLDFNIMYANRTNFCKTPSNAPNAPPYYACKFIRNSPAIAGIGPAPSGFTSRAGLVQYVYFKCRDHPEAGYNGTRNFNKDAYTIVLRGSDPLSIIDTQPTGTIKTSTSLVNVTLQVQTSGGALLNGNSVCKYTTDEVNKENLAAMTEFLNTNSSLHTQPWQPSSGPQNFYVGCYDLAGNRNFTTINFTVERDVTPPFIVRTYRDVSFQPPQFTVEINEPGECKDSVEGTFDYNTEGNLMNAVGTSGRIFSSTVPNSNVYYVVCRDQFNNTMVPATIQIAVV